MSSAVHCSLSLLELPGRSEAEAALRVAVQAGHPPLSAILVAVGVLDAIGHFGFQSSDKLVLKFSQYWMGVLPPGICIYRWSGTAFLCVPEGDGLSPESFEAIFREAMMHPPVVWVHWHELETPVALRTSFAVFGAGAPQSQKELVRSIDYFVASNAS
jgi:GGDEF domain-containing protein